MILSRIFATGYTYVDGLIKVLEGLSERKSLFNATTLILAYSLLARAISAYTLCCSEGNI